MGGESRLARLEIRGYRSLADVTLAPGPLLALVGEASAGKSNVLRAIRLLLDAEAPPPTQADTWQGAGGEIEVRGEMADGGPLVYAAGEDGEQRTGDQPDLLFLPAELRAAELVGAATGGARPAGELLAGGVDGGSPRGRSAAANALVSGVEALCEGAYSAAVILVEEPELYLRPQAQRYLYRLLLTLSEAGNQVFYSTNSPAFLNVARLHELGLVTFDRERGTAVHQPDPLPATSEFRALSEFDAERGELLLARAALLVEGLTEKVVFPFVFRALGLDVDQLGISIVECGGKTNLALFARVCHAAGIPCVAVHDSDASPSGRVANAHRVLNEQVAAVVGEERVVVLDPDFEGVAGLTGARRKPEQARLYFIAGRDVPEPLQRAAELVASLARD